MRKSKNGPKKFAKILCIVLVFFSSTAFASKNMPLAENSNSLEVKVWTAPKAELNSLEPEIMRLMQEKPEEVYSSYLASIYYMKKYKEQNIGLDAIRRASLLARQAIDLDETSSYGYLALANIAIEIGQSQKALELIEQIDLAEVSTDWRQEALKAKLYVHLGHTSDKIDHFNKLVDKKVLPEKLFIYFAYPMLEDLPSRKAVKTTRLWLSKNPSSNNHFLLGRSFQRDSNYKMAHRYYRKAISKKSNNLDLYVEDGIILMNEMKDYKKAISRFERSIEIAKESKQYSQTIKADINLHLGFANLLAGDQKSAIESHVTSMRSYNQKEKLVRHLTAKYRAYQKPKELKKLLEKINLEVPGLALSYALLGEVVANDLNKPKEAVEIYANAITIDPDNSTYYNGLGLAFYKLENYVSAEKVFTIATKIDPNDATARYNVACMQALQGQSSLAITNLKTAISLDPDLLTSALSDKDFSTIRNLPSFKALTREALAH